VKVLFDTHALLWAALGSKRLSPVAREVVADETNDLFVSAVSAWEISTKVRLGKLPEAVEFEREFLSDIEDAGYTLLSIDAASALRAGRFKGEHRDPFDRMIAAQALSQDMIVLSNDTKLDAFGVRRLW
jgi:PIN domain nuclease of toxin-antitoxin system